MKKEKYMRAIQFTQHGDYQQLHLVDLAQPTPAPGEVLVKMTAAAVNPVDNIVRLGYMPGAKQPPQVPGVEGVGTIVSSTIGGFSSGQRVIVRVGAKGFGVWDDGVWQEYVAALPDEISLIPLPDTVSDVQAAGMASSYLTAVYALTITGGFQAGQRVLAPAVGGAVGNALVQVAYASGASRVLTTAGSTAKAEKARKAGYTDVIDLSQESLSEGVMRLTDGAGVHVAVDSVGGAITGQALSSLAQEGTLVVIGYSGGVETTASVTDLVFKEARVLGLNLFTRPASLIAQAKETMLQLATEGKIKPLVGQTFPLAEAAEAQRFLMEERPFGRVVLTM